MFRQSNSSPQLTLDQLWRLEMLKKAHIIFVGLIIVLLVFLVLQRDRLCELHVRGGNVELSASMTYEVKR